METLTCIRHGKVRLTATASIRLIFRTWEPPPPLLSAIPSPRTLVWSGNGNQAIWPYCFFSTWLHGRRTVKRYPSVSILNFRFFGNCSDKQMSCWFPGIYRHLLLWISSQGTRIINIFILHTFIHIRNIVATVYALKQSYLIGFVFASHWINYLCCWNCFVLLAAFLDLDWNSNTVAVPRVRWRRPRRGRITPRHLLIWSCVSELLYLKARAGYALQPSLTRKPQLQSYTIQVWLYETFIVSASSLSG